MRWRESRQWERSHRLDNKSGQVTCGLCAYRVLAKPKVIIPTGGRGRAERGERNTYRAKSWHDVGCPDECVTYAHASKQQPPCQLWLLVFLWPKDEKERTDMYIAHTWRRSLVSGRSCCFCCLIFDERYLRHLFLLVVVVYTSRFLQIFFLTLWGFGSRGRIVAARRSAASANLCTCDGKRVGVGWVGLAGAPPPLGLGVVPLPHEDSHVPTLKIHTPFIIFSCTSELKINTWFDSA